MMLKMPITIEINGWGFFLIGFSILSSVLSLSSNFRKKYQDQISVICVKLKGIFEEKIKAYHQLSQSFGQENIQDRETRESNLEKLLNEINYLSNEYYDWSHKCTDISKDLRKSFMWGIAVMALSLAFFIHGTAEVVGQVAVLKFVSIILIAVISFNNILPNLYEAYYSVPNKIDSKHQEVRDGIFTPSWTRDD